MTSAHTVFRYVCTECHKANDTREPPTDSVLQCWNCNRVTVQAFKEIRNNIVRTRRKMDHA